MNSRHRKLVLVLMTLVGSTLIWAGCAGMAEPLPSLAVAPASLTVSAKVGSTSALPVTITNTGQTPLSVTQAVLSGTGFSMSGLATPVTLPGGQSTSFTIKFAASQVGVVNGNVEFMTDSRHAPHTLPLHGTGSSQNPLVASIVVSPPVATPAPSAKVQFTAAIQGATANDAVTWAASIGTISATGVFTAPPISGIGTILATSVADPTKSATATVAVAGATPPPSGSGVTGVTVMPGTASSVTGGMLQFKASVAGTTTNTAVTWKALLGTITSDGSYTAPAKAGADTVTATSVAESTKSGSATVTVTAPAAAPVVSSISVSPSTANVSTGGTKQFSASVQGTVTDTSVMWTAALGTINSSGLYTAPAKAGTDTVTATSNAQSTKSASATVTVTAATPTQTAACGSSGCAAFAGVGGNAEGGGAESLGGRGGVVIEVTNLNDSGTGSLRACVEASGPRTCIFRVSGLITSLSRLAVTNPYITIAGQTAPGGGIVLGGYNQQGEQLDVQTHDVIVRYLTYDGNSPRPTGPDTGTVGFEMANGGSTSAYNVVFDHLSGRWVGNKFPVYANDSTGNTHIYNSDWQWCLFYEPNIGHPVGPLMSAIAYPNEDHDVDWHHNLFMNMGHRIPLVMDFGQWRMVSNITFNWDYFAVGQNGNSSDFINNLWVAGNLNNGNSNPHPLNITLNADANDGTCLSNCDDPGTPSIYMSGNVGPQGTDYQLSAEEAGTDPEGFPEVASPIRSGWQRSTPLPAEPFPIIPDAANSLDSVLLPTVGNSQHLDCNGNFVSNRDSQDTRVTNQYIARGPGGEFAGPNYQGPSSGPSVPAGTPCQESLHDGIPDQWKVLKGLSTTDSNLFRTTAPNGYTWLENYLNGQ